MTTSVSDGQLGQAVLDYVQNGSYPDAEEVISAELPTSAFSTLLTLFDSARQEAKDDIKTISRNEAGDIDGWISQAKRLHQDIEKSKVTAQEIVREAEAGRKNQEDVKDASSKASLLKAEVAFNATLAEALEGIGRVQKLLDLAQEAAVADKLPEAVDQLKEAETSLALLAEFRTTSAVRLVGQSIEQLRRAIKETLDECWSAMVIVDQPASRITLKHAIQRGTIIEMEAVVLALDKLELLDAKVDTLYQDLDRTVISPLLDHPAEKSMVMVSVDGDDIDTSKRRGNSGINHLFEDLHAITDYLSKRLPRSTAIPLSQTFMPSLTLRLISLWLNPSVPSSLEGIQEFQDILTLVNRFVERAEALEWKGTSNMNDWAGNAPRVWLTRRREKSLDLVRNLLSASISETKQVERVETEKVAQDEGGMFATSGEDDWNANWSDDEKEHDREKAAADDEDVDDAWGLNAEDDSDHPQRTAGELPADDEEDVGDAWGWGEENEAANDDDASQPAPSKAAKSPKPKSSAQNINGSPPSRSHPRKPREMTLRETYTITTVPSSLLSLITTIISDANTLSSAAAPSPYSSIAPAASGLYALPTLILAMYRAASPPFYTTSDSGKMYLYNDTLHLSSTLASLSASPPFSSAPPARLAFLTTDAQTLLQLGRRAYTTELSSHRLILTDLLDGAQAFANCTVPPFSTSCDTAVASAISWLRDLHRRWAPILSRSALLQSLGSLLSSAVSKVIVEIEDLPDISEPESKKLVALCNRFLALNALFLPPSAGDEEAQEPTPLTAVYTPSWLRFQYLISILEGSLADIKYLWEEGELRLEFATEEVVELVEALFADSEYRRKAIGDIRRGGGA